MSKDWRIRARPDQIIYVKKMMAEEGATNESAAVKSLIDGGIARREEVLRVETLLRVCVQQLTLLRRMASAVDQELIVQAKNDAEKMLLTLTSKGESS